VLQHPDRLCGPPLDLLQEVRVLLMLGTPELNVLQVGGHRNDQRYGTLLLCRKAERVEVVQPGEEKVLVRPYCGLSVLKGDLQERWGQTF